MEKVLSGNLHVQRTRKEGGGSAWPRGAPSGESRPRRAHPCPALGGGATLPAAAVIIDCVFGYQRVVLGAVARRHHPFLCAPARDGRRCAHESIAGVMSRRRACPHEQRVRWVASCARCRTNCCACSGRLPIEAPAEHARGQQNAQR